MKTENMSRVLTILEVTSTEFDKLTQKQWAFVRYLARDVLLSEKDDEYKPKTYKNTLSAYEDEGNKPPF